MLSIPRLRHHQHTDHIDCKGALPSWVQRGLQCGPVVLRLLFGRGVPAAGRGSAATGVSFPVLLPHHCWQGAGEAGIGRQQVLADSREPIKVMRGTVWQEQVINLTECGQLQENWQLSAKVYIAVTVVGCREQPAK